MQTPISSASCCFHGVAPIRKPVFRSCDVSPAFADAMQTTPPIVMASAPKAGAVHPFTRKMAEVAINVAIVMPEIGLAELPISPTMREETVTNRNPNTTTSRDAARLASRLVCAPGTGLNVRNRNIKTTSRTEPPTTTDMGKSRSVRFSAAAAARDLSEALRAFAECAPDGRQRAQQGKNAGRRHRARAHRPHIRRPQIAGSHLRDRLRSRIDCALRHASRRSGSPASAPARRRRRPAKIVPATRGPIM